MSQLVPCPGCERHVRLSDSNCPFCSRELDGKALGAAYAARRGQVPSGLKRAALVALGASVAAACGGRTDGTGQDTLPVASTGVTSDGASTGVTSEESSSATDSWPGNGTQIAIYGAPPVSSDVSTTEGLHDSTEPVTSSSPDDDDWSPLPPYGFPIITDPDPFPDTTTPVPSSSTSAPDVDTGSNTGPEVLDAGPSDAGVPDATEEGDAGLSTEGPIAQPAYGAPILTE